MTSLLVAVLVFAICIHSGNSLVCFKCTNVEITSGTGFFDALKGKSDPLCGTSPSSGNTVTCPSGQVCGSIQGEISASSLFGRFTAKTQVRNCMPNDHKDSVIGGCTKSDTRANEIVGTMLGLASVGLSNVQVDGLVCTCNFDLCTLCNGGFDIAGHCVKYWMMGLIGAGMVTVILLLITCCCCCCGCCGCCCCKTKHRGVVLSPAVPYQTLTVIQPSGSTSGLSIQSGDIVQGYENPAATGAYYAYSSAAPPTYSGAPTVDNHKPATGGQGSSLVV